jgi:putative ABC transport system permease protein
MERNKAPQNRIVLLRRGEAAPGQGCIIAANVRPNTRTALVWRIAWRDLWTGRRHFAVAMASLAVGVASMNAARGLSAEFSLRLNGDMRHWIAADASVTLRQPPTEEQRRAVAALAGQGVDATESMDAYSMAASEQSADPSVVSVKSVDARFYPWYGAVELEPKASLRNVLSADTAVVSRALCERLAVRAGEMIEVNGVAFRIAAILVSEPDRFAASPNPYPRVILSDAGFARTQIVRRGNAIIWRLLLRTPARSNVGLLKARLQEIFPDGQVLDYRDHGDARIGAALNAALTFLDLAGWTALVLGAVSVALVIYLHIEQRLDTVAILKVLGGGWGQILCIYLLEIGCLAVAGGAVGAVLAVPLERVFPLLARDQLPFRLTLGWRWGQAIEAVALGVVASLVTTAVPLIAIRTTAPLVIFRRYVERPATWRRLRVIVWSSCVVVMFSLALATLHSPKPGAAFLAGLVAAGLVLARLGREVMRIARRPGRQVGTRFVALASGVMVVTASWLGPAAVVRSIGESLPMLQSDLFVFALGADQTGPLVEALSRDPDVRAPVELLPVVILRLATVNGAPLREGVPERYAATCLQQAPAGRLTTGRWWQTGTAEVVVSESLARMVGASDGARLEFYSNGRRLDAQVVGLRRLDAIEEARGGLLFPCSAFAGMSVLYEAGISVRPGRTDAVRRAVIARYPSVPVIAREEVTAAIDSIVNEALWLLRAVSLLILAAGTVALVLMVLAEEKVRTREIAVLKILGARPGQVRNTLLAEFAWLGGLAGASGGVLGSGFASLLLTVVFRKAVLAWDARVLGGAILLGLATAVVAGWASTARMLQRRPYVILREE